MVEETFFRLQHSESVICHMASRLLAAQIAAGRLSADTEEALLEQCLDLAIKLARKADRAIESDNENSEH